MEARLVVAPIVGNWDEAYTSLVGNKTQEFLARLCTVELFDYSAIEDVLRNVTRMVHARMAEPPTTDDGEQDHQEQDRTKWQDRVSVIPRGSFASRTALAGTADLDLDIVTPRRLPAARTQAPP